MNLIDCKVIEVLYKPVYKYKKWFLKVRYECEGLKSTTQLMFDRKEQALQITVGHIFQA